MNCGAALVRAIHKRSGLLVCMALPALSAGCTHDRPLNVSLNESVRLPERAAVLFLVDGLDATRMNEMCEAGQLPNIRGRLIERGCRVRNACSSLPSITYSNLTSILTGQFPGTHGITGNKWFDRHSLRMVNYSTTKTYRDVDGDFRSPTLYEYLSDDLTAGIQCAVRRGSTRIIDNWATSGINWFFQGFNEVDKLIAMRFELIAQMSNEVGRWPVLVNAYFPGVDETGHRYGADSPQYGKSLRNVDAQIGRILDAYERIGLSNRTTFVLTSDHGHVPIEADHRLDIADWLRKHAELRVLTNGIAAGSYENRYVAMKSVDAVLINGGNRRVAIHIRGEECWNDEPNPERVLAILSAGGGLWKEPPVGLIAVRGSPNRVLIIARDGRATVERTFPDFGAEREYALRCEQGDPLGYLQDAALGDFVRSGAHGSKEWSARTASSAYPDFVPQIVELFDSPRTGDVVVFAADGATFDRTSKGGHGSAARRDMIVPLIWRGPGIPEGTSMESARTVDILPTLLEFIDRPLPPTALSALDGVSVAADLRGAEASP